MKDAALEQKLCSFRTYFKLDVGESNKTGTNGGSGLKFVSNELFLNSTFVSYDNYLIITTIILYLTKYLLCRCIIITIIIMVDVVLYNLMQYGDWSHQTVWCLMQWRG